MIPRKIQPLSYTIQGNMPVSDPMAELDDHVRNGEYTYLIAYAHDGVIWGYIQEGRLEVSGDVFPEISPPLRMETLWELRLFGENAEWHLWRTENGWQSCLVKDGAGDPGQALDEQYILWGTDPQGEARKSFWPVREADLGILHAPPLEMKKRHSLRLSVRHYIGHDEAGATYVILSRLKSLENGGAA